MDENFEWDAADVYPEPAQPDGENFFLYVFVLLQYEVVVAE